MERTNNYNDLKPFRFWCQKVLPLVYDDSLSYYELLYKVIDYLNKTIEDVTVLNDDTEAMYAAYNQLQSYVNNYFDNLDVQQEIDNKLDAMVLDGTLTRLVRPFVGEAVSDWLEDNVEPTGSVVLLDRTMTVRGAAADAEAVGFRLSEKEDILAFDDAPTAGSMAPVHSYGIKNYVDGAVANVVGEIADLRDDVEDEITDLNGDLSELNKKVDDECINPIMDGYSIIPTVANQTFASNGTFTNNPNRLRTDMIPVKTGDTIVIDNGTLKHACGAWNGTPSTATNVRNDGNFSTDDETIISAINGFYVVVFAKQDPSQPISLSEYDGTVSVNNSLISQNARRIDKIEEDVYTEIPLTNSAKMYTRYSDGERVNSNTSNSFFIQNDGIKSIKFNSNTGTSGCAIAFYKTHKQYSSSYMKSASVHGLDNTQVLEYEAIVPDDAKLIVLHRNTSSSYNDGAFVVYKNDYISRKRRENQEFCKLKANPYDSIPWSIIKDVPSVSHAHCDSQTQFNTLKAHYRHLAISNYHPAVPTYPLDQWFTGTDGVLASPNAEYSAFDNTMYPSTHMNTIGSILYGGEGYPGTEEDMVLESITTRQYMSSGGVTINHPAWSGLTKDGIEYLASIPGVIAMEIYDADVIRGQHPENQYSTSLWDEVLSDGIQLYGLAVPDHEAQYSVDEVNGYGYNHLLVVNETELECLSAYRQGRFYTTVFNDGLLLENYTLASDRTLTIEVSESSTFKFITATRTVEVDTANTSATFAVTGSDIYVRCEVTRGNNKLFTNAIML